MHHTQTVVLNGNVSQRSCSTAFPENTLFHYIIYINTTNHSHQAVVGGIDVYDHT